MKEKEQSKSRRAFLKGAAAGAGAESVQVDIADTGAAIDVTVRHNAPYSLDLTAIVDRIDAHDGRLSIADHRISIVVPALTVTEEMLT